MPELLAIGVTVLLVDYANERRADRELKAQLIRQMGSKHPEVAATSLEELRPHNWLYDGSLQGAYLEGANLQGAHLLGANLAGANLAGANLQNVRLEAANLKSADLVEANLQDAHLWGANLQNVRLEGANLQGAHLLGANLAEANLQGAHLTGEAGLGDVYSRAGNLWRTYWVRGKLLEAIVYAEANLQGANLLRANLQDAHVKEPQMKEVRRHVGAIMPDGDCYMGKFNLEHDKVYAKIQGVDINDPEALERWYKEQCEVARAYHRKRGWLRDDDD